MVFLVLRDGISIIHFSADVSVDILSFVIGVLMILFAILDFIPWSSRLTIGRQHFVTGGFLSGFFGGCLDIKGHFVQLFWRSQT